MHKKDLTQEISKQTDLTAKASGEAIDAILATISKSLKKGDDVGAVANLTFS